MAKLGQHFLNSDLVAERIVSAARLEQGDSVVEIGPGKGILTERLLAYGLPVCAVELDVRLHEGLKERFGDIPGLKLIHGDFLKLDMEELPSPAVFVANLPYAVAAPILQKILAWPGWKRAVLMFQKEVAERLVAEPGSRKYGLLTVSVALKANVEWVTDVPKRFFSPVPAVDSAVVALYPREESILPPSITEEQYLGIVRGAFAHRRKTVSNSLEFSTDFSKQRIVEALKSAELDPMCRAETIAPEEFARLCQKFYS